MSDTLVPEAENESAPPATEADVRSARILNLLGLVTPLANLGMRRLAPPALRSFGVGAGCIFWAVGGWALWRGHTGIAAGAAVAHLALVLAGLADPRLPEVPGRAWIAFGAGLGRVVSVPIFAALYFLVVTPTAVLVRILVGDPLRKKAPPRASYWVDREPAPRERFERQF